MEKGSLRPGKALLDTLGAAHAVLSGLVASIPPDRIALRRRPHFWTIQQHISHLAEVQPMLAERLERFRDEAAPSIIPYNPPDDGEEKSPLEIEEALAQFARWRTHQIEIIDSLSDDVWQKEGLHPEYERYTPSILVRHIAMHDHWHMYRIEELWITKDEYLTEVQ